MDRNEPDGLDEDGATVKAFWLSCFHGSHIL